MGNENEKMRYHTKGCNSQRGPQYPCDCGNPLRQFPKKRAPDPRLAALEDTLSQIRRLANGESGTFAAAIYALADSALSSTGSEAEEVLAAARAAHPVWSTDKIDAIIASLERLDASRRGEDGE